MTDIKRTIAIIVAAGNGSRAGDDIPKQFRQIHGQAMLRHSYTGFLGHPGINDIIIVIGPGQEEEAKIALKGLPLPRYVIGGATRRESVKNGLATIACSGGADIVLIHDAARPFLPDRIIHSLLDILKGAKAAVPALPIVDSLARGTSNMAETVDRDGLWRIQTPQAFHFDVILAAHQNWGERGEPSDDARMVQIFGHKVAFVPGDEALNKYTFARDFDESTRHGKGPSPMITDMRTGTGFDVHQLVTGRELWLCGVQIDHHQGLSGHSDADVAIHALTDAILGAAALGDIGDHFPPSDGQWKNMSSDRFLTYAVKLALDEGYSIGNVDITIICEAPKIGPHKDRMRRRLAEIMSIAHDRVSVKATTTEKLGFAGRGEGIATQANVSLIKWDTK